MQPNRLSLLAHSLGQAAVVMVPLNHTIFVSFLKRFRPLLQRWHVRDMLGPDQ